MTTNNIMVTGTELKQIIQQDQEKYKKRIHNKIKAQMYGEISLLSPEKDYQEGVNDIIELILMKIIKAY